MSTIKQIIQDFCYRVNIPAATAYVGVSSPNEQQLLSLFKFIGDNLRNRPYQWPQLKRPYYFNTATGVANYQLPGDFYRILDASQWDVTNNWPLRGPLSDWGYAVRNFSVVDYQNRKAFRLTGAVNYLYSTAPYTKRSAGWFQIDPAGQNNTDELFLGYLSCNWIWPRDWVASTSYSLGDIRSGDGYVYICTTAGTSGTTRPSVTSGTETDGTVTWTFYTEPYQADSSNASLNDEDICLFDDDIMIEGMRWAYFRAKKQDYQQERADWENMVKSAYARFNGVSRGNMGGVDESIYSWFNIPDGSWNV